MLSNYIYSLCPHDWTLEVYSSGDCIRISTHTHLLTAQTKILEVPIPCLVFKYQEVGSLFKTVVLHKPIILNIRNCGTN